jgi:hypothetical protein
MKDYITSKKRTRFSLLQILKYELKRYIEKKVC